MLRWIKNLLKPEVPLDYIIGEYQPSQFNRLRNDFAAEMEELEAFSKTVDSELEALYQHQ